MHDYWLTQYLLAAVGWGYIIAALIALGLALWIPKGKKAKLVAGAIVLGLVSILPVQGYQDYLKEKGAARDIAQRQAEARTLFGERCKTAGEKVWRVVSDVEGVYLINLRKAVDTRDQYDPGDPAGDSATGQGYIETFFLGRDKSDSTSAIVLTHRNRRGAYRFVEAPVQGGDGLVRYADARVNEAGSIHGAPLKLATMAISQRSARYGVESTDISTKEDRRHWIAGSRIRVIDLHTNELLGERIGFMIDMAQGSTDGGRQPWVFARYSACPPFPKMHDRYPDAWGLTRSFVQKVAEAAGGN